VCRCTAHRGWWSTGPTYDPNFMHANPTPVFTQKLLPLLLRSSPSSLQQALQKLIREFGDNF
jgi:hypothetical protein